MPSEYSLVKSSWGFKKTGRPLP
uniref:Uncharacterized protein n=1 Tax=Anguilla anguilla TaxID=7936 RepID=A0A0E9QPR2_ANGAN